MGVQLHVAAKAGDLQTAEIIAERMQANGCALTVVSYGMLINAFAKAGDVAGAERWLNELMNSGLGKPNVICVNSTISACAKGGEVRKAEAWLERMPAMGVQPDTMSYNAVIDACARNGDIDRAESWLNRRKKEGTPPNVVSFSS